MSLRETDVIHAPQHPPPTNQLSQYTCPRFRSGHTVLPCTLRLNAGLNVLQYEG